MPNSKRGRRNGSANSDDPGKDGRGNKKAKTTSSSKAKPKRAQGKSKSVRKNIRTITPEIEELITEFKNQISEYPAKGGYPQWVDKLVEFIQTNGHPDVQFRHVDRWIDLYAWIVVPWCLDPRIVPKTRKKPADFEAQRDRNRNRNNKMVPENQESFNRPCCASSTIAISGINPTVPAAAASGNNPKPSGINPTVPAAAASGNNPKPTTDVLKLLGMETNHSDIVIAAWLAEAKFTRQLGINTEKMKQDINAVLEDDEMLEEFIESLPAELFESLAFEDPMEIPENNEVSEITDVDESLEMQVPPDSVESANSETAAMNPDEAGDAAARNVNLVNATSPTNTANSECEFVVAELPENCEILRVFEVNEDSNFIQAYESSILDVRDDNNPDEAVDEAYSANHDRSKDLEFAESSSSHWTKYPDDSSQNAENPESAPELNFELQAVVPYTGNVHPYEMYAAVKVEPTASDMLSRSGSGSDCTVPVQHIVPYGNFNSGPSGGSLLCVPQYQPLLQRGELEQLNTKFTQVLHAAETVGAIQALAYGRFRENEMRRMKFAFRNILRQIGGTVMQSTRGLAEINREPMEPGSGVTIIQLDSDGEEIEPDNNAQ